MARYVCVKLLLTGTIIGFLHIDNVTPQFIWYKNAKKNNKTIEIPIQSVTTDKQAHYNTPEVEQNSNYTLDEKCSQGLGIGLGYQAYTPYVNMGMGPKYKNLILSGIFPHLLQHMLAECCPKSKIEHAKYLVSIDELERHYGGKSGKTAMDIDISFPAYGHKGEATSSLRDFPFIALVTAPKIFVLVKQHFFTNLRVKVLVSTILDMWPILVFIMISACLAGLIVWWLDKRRNKKDFPEHFFKGTWEGIWCAFITMTTVGYGDVTPKSFLARVFCMLWILLGTIVVSLFTGLVASAVQTTSQHRFNIMGTPIGAVRGSIEYQVGVGMNADMRSYDNVITMIDRDLIRTQEIHAALVDNFVYRASKDIFNGLGVHMEMELDHPVTYGVVLARNSSRLETCFRHYVSHNPHKVFEVIAETLTSRVPSNSEQLFRQTLEAAMVEEVLYEDEAFKTVLYVMVGFLMMALCFGIWREYFWKGEKLSCGLPLVQKSCGDENYWNSFLSQIQCLGEKNSDQSVPINVVCQESTSFVGQEEKCSMERNRGEKCNSSSNLSNEQLNAFVSEYEDFHTRWIAKVRSFHDT